MTTNYRIRISRIHSNIFWDYLLVYLLLLLSAGFFFRHQYNRYTQPVYLSLLLLTIVKRDIKLKIDILIPTLSLIALIVITAIITGLGYYQNYVFCIISILTAYFVTQIYNYKRFFSLFSNCILCICIASIIGWMLVETIPSFVTAFPKLVNSVGFDGHFLVLTILGVPNYAGFQNRAQGIFWEPGAFQTMIVIAVIGDLFINDTASKRKRTIIYFVALALTLSTTGYICFAILIMILAVKDKKKIPILGMLLTLFLAVGIMLLVYFKDRLPHFLYFTLFTKMEAVLSYRPGAAISDLAAEKTAYVRMNSVYYPMIGFLKSPLWGIGFSGYNQMGEMLGYGNMFTFTPINIFAYFGVIYASISVYGFLRTIKQINASFFCKCLIVLLIIVTISSEDYCVGVASITVFLLYGYGNFNYKYLLKAEGYEKIYESSLYQQL